MAGAGVEFRFHRRKVITASLTNRKKGGVLSQRVWLDDYVQGVGYKYNLG